MAEDTSTQELETEDYMSGSDIEMEQDVYYDDEMIKELDNVNANSQSDTNDNDNQNPEEHTDLVSQVLASMNINPDNIKIVDENGESSSVKFSDLSQEEQLDILTSRSQQPSGPQITEDEWGLINNMRKSGLSSVEFVDSIRKKAIEESTLNINDSVTVDNMTDDEVFVSDLISRFDLSDEEAADALRLEKANPTVFAKKVESLRKSIKAAEIETKTREEEMRLEQEKQAYDKFIGDLYKSSGVAKQIGKYCELDDDDIKESIEFLTQEDGSGTRYIQRALSEPDSLIKMAWFYLNGEKAIDDLCKGYEKQIADLQKKVGQTQTRDNSKTSQRSSVVKKKSEPSNPGKAYGDLTEYRRQQFGPGF